MAYLAETKYRHYTTDTSKLKAEIAYHCKYREPKPKSKELANSRLGVINDHVHRRTHGSINGKCIRVFIA